MFSHDELFNNLYLGEEEFIEKCTRGEPCAIPQVAMNVGDNSGIVAECFLNAGSLVDKQA